jgi:hypothetical protein
MDYIVNISDLILTHIYMQICNNYRNEQCIDEAM